MRQPLTPNHLAKVIDHQKSAVSVLPEQLKSRCMQLTKLTDEITTLLDNCLPKEILNTLWVGKYEDGYLTLSVQSQTAANHLRYQSNNLINILKEQSLTFVELKHLNVIVTHPDYIQRLGTKNTVYDLQNKQLYLVDKTNQNLINHGLTESMKQTISHVTEHVITDERLKKALRKLVKR